MAIVSTIYNTLPSVEHANNVFLDRRTVMLEALAPLIAKYDNQWGVCLVHAHCTLASDEIMVATGNVSEPKTTSELKRSETQVYAERWLKDGTPYEFTTERTVPPPAELVVEFKKIIGDVAVLGLYFSGGASPAVKLEHTEGRANITIDCTLSETDTLHTLQTAWVPGVDMAPRMVCVIYCDTRLTRSGKRVHTSSRTHAQVPEAK